MPHIEPLSDDQATEAAKSLFEPLQSALGMVPNIFRTMAHAPDVLAAGRRHPGRHGPRLRTKSVFHSRKEVVSISPGRAPLR